VRFVTKRSYDDFRSDFRKTGTKGPECARIESRRPERFLRCSQEQGLPQYWSKMSKIREKEESARLTWFGQGCMKCGATACRLRTLGLRQLDWRVGQRRVLFTTMDERHSAEPLWRPLRMTFRICLCCRSIRKQPNENEDRNPKHRRNHSRLQYTLSGSPGPGRRGQRPTSWILSPGRSVVRADTSPKLWT